MRAPGAGVPPVSLRAEARPADLRRPVPHPKPGAHSERQREEVRFASDSPLEEAVTSEPVSEVQN
jgi:hypothetical protein